MRQLTGLLCALSMLVACSSPAASTGPSTPTRVPLLPTTESTAKPTRAPVGAQSLPTQAPSATDEPLATLEPASSTPLNGMTDDFSDSNSGWDVSSGKEGSVGYENGEYVIKVDAVDYTLWANPGKTFGDVLAGVTARLGDNSAPADMGVICRYQDESNFIYGEITSDGYYGIEQLKSGDLTILTGSGKLQRSSVIRQGGPANQIQFLCAGNHYTLIVNEQVVAEIDAEAPTSGDVGLLAGTFEKAGAQVHFDDFSAAPPPAGLTVGNPPSSGQALFTDDFSDPKSGWDVRTTDNGASGYQDGRYFLRVDTPKYQLWSTPGQLFKGDVAVEVTAVVGHGPQDNEMGVICRYQDRQNFMYGSIGADGYYAIGEIKADKDTILTGAGKFQQSDAIPVGGESYDIRFTCEGDRYTLYVNGEKIDSASSSAFTRGDAGLLAGTFDQGGLEVLFDDFSVSTP